MAEQFGARHRYQVDTPAEAVRALIANKRGFKEAISTMEVRLIRSKPNVEHGLELDVEMLQMGMAEGSLHIIPLPAGAKDGGIGKAVLGIVLIAAVIMTAGGASPFAAGAFGAAGAYGGLAGNILLGGFAMALGGVSMMLAPTPKADDNADKGSFLFNGATNVSAQGGPVPLVYGDVLTGSVVGSLSITDEQVTISAVASGPYEGFGGNSFGGFGDLFGGTLTTGTFTGMPGGVGGTWDIETDDNTLAAVTRLSLVD